jgi:hypothetical protein
MSKCEGCEHWVVRRETRYGGGDVITNWQAPDGKGACNSLGIETEAAFGCNRFLEDLGWSHVESSLKDGYPWQHFVMIDCPDCNGKGDGGRGHRCAGTGKVRLYDDGHLGDEQTRLHPNEKPLPTSCFSCGQPVDKNWAHCPACGRKLWKQAETEVVSNEAAGLPPPEMPQ